MNSFSCSSNSSSCSSWMKRIANLLFIFNYTHMNTYIHSFSYTYLHRYTHMNTRTHFVTINYTNALSHIVSFIMSTILLKIIESIIRIFYMFFTAFINFMASHVRYNFLNHQMRQKFSYFLEKVFNLMPNVGTGQRVRSRERWRYDSFLNYTSQAGLIRICHSIKQEEAKIWKEIQNQGHPLASQVTSEKKFLSLPKMQREPAFIINRFSKTNILQSIPEHRAKTFTWCNKDSQKMKGVMASSHSSSVL